MGDSVTLGFLLVFGCNSELSIDDMADVSDYPSATPSEAPLRRISASQYERSIRIAFNDNANAPELVVPRIAEPDVTSHGFQAIGASESSFSSRGIESIEQASYAIAHQITESDYWVSKSLPCDPVIEQTCYEAIAKSIGKKLWRRTLSQTEVDRLKSIAATAADTLNEPRAGATFLLSALIQSPHFWYRNEGRGGQLSSTDLASKLSHLIWNAPPNTELTTKAENGELDTREGLFETAAWMLDSPEASAGVAAFFTDYLRLYKLDNLSKDPTLFEHFSSDLGADAQQETISLIDYLLMEVETDYRELFTTRESFVNPRLSAIYNIPAPSEDFGHILYPLDHPRRGLTSQVAFLAQNSHSTSTSATLRGLAVRAIFLCQEIPPAPVNVDTSIPEPSGTTLTLRDRVAEHLEDASCAGCHNLMDPIGLGFEQYDSIGRWRLTDNGATIDPHGSLDGKDFSTPAELGQRISEHSKLSSCFVRSLSRYGNGRVEDLSEQALLELLTERMEHHEHRFKPMVLEYILSPLFLNHGE